MVYNEPKFDFDDTLKELGFESIGIVVIEPERDFDYVITEFICKMFIILALIISLYS